jgi:hypothetical protein
LLIYGIIFIIGLLLTIIGIYEKKYDKICYFFFSIILIFLAGFRFGISSDYFAYLELYENSTNQRYNIGRTEYGYYLLNKLFFSIGLPFGLFLAFTTSIVIFNTYFALKNFNANKMCGLFVYFCLFYFVNIFNLVRHGIAASFILYAYSLVVKEKTFKAVIILLVAFLFHNVSIAFFPIVFISKIKFHKVFIILSIILCYELFINRKIIIDKFISDILPERYVAYVWSYIGIVNISKIGIGTIMFIFLFILFSICKKRILLNNIENRFNIAYNMMYSSLILLIVFWSIPTVLERLLNISRQGLIILIPYFLLSFRNNKKILVTMMIIVFCLAFFCQTMLISDISKKYTHFPYQWRP